jgi:hypothetical protein
MFIDNYINNNTSNNIPTIKLIGYSIHIDRCKLFGLFLKKIKINNKLDNTQHISIDNSIDMISDVDFSCRNNNINMYDYNDVNINISDEELQNLNI